MNIGIVGHEAAKFTPETESKARRIIQSLLIDPWCVVVSGGCHLGGVDIWAEEEAKAKNCATSVFFPETRLWSDGYKPRNIKIAETSEIVHVIVVRRLPATYDGMRFDFCYHCKTNSHVKSGGCWTAHYALKLGKSAEWHIIE